MEATQPQKPHRNKNRFRNIVLISLVFALAGIVMGCESNASSTQEPADSQPPTEIPATPVPPTDTPLPIPTATEVPPPTSTPTNTPLPPLAIESDGFSAWCIPIDTLVSKEYEKEPWRMPEVAKPSYIRDDRPNLYLPVVSCTFVYTFNQPVPAGSELQVFQGTDSEPWLSAELIPVPDNPNIAYAILTHPMIINPPVWVITYPMYIVSLDEPDLWAEEIIMRRWEPEPCWDGSWPDPVTMWCPIEDS